MPGCERVRAGFKVQTLKLQGGAVTHVSMGRSGRRQSGKEFLHELWDSLLGGGAVQAEAT